MNVAFAISVARPLTLQRLAVKADIPDRQVRARSRLFTIDGIPNCACHQAPMPTLLLRGWEPNDAATLWELQIASDAMSLDA
jgi:hypothetical protein